MPATSSGAEQKPALVAAVAPTQQKPVLVLTALPATYSISSALAEGTSIRVMNVPSDGRPMNALRRYFEKPSDEVLGLLQKADAVVTIGKLWHDDPLFLAARAQNIRVVDIDATEPYSTTLPGIALVRQPDGQAPWEKGAANANGGASPLFWVGPSNAARAAEIVAHDLARLSPQDAERVAQNLARYRGKLLDLKRRYEARLSTYPNVSVFALAADFGYLTTDLGLFVDGYFIRQDLEWTPGDLEAFRKYLTEHDIKVVIHKWEPSDAIQAAVKAAGAKLVVLRSSESFAAGAVLREASYTTDLEANLKALDAALAE
jgi:ABC-type Zn uptake system ZnuABC Zn-binding protein ZnuA